MRFGMTSGAAERVRARRAKRQRGPRTRQSPVSNALLWDGAFKALAGATCRGSLAHYETVKRRHDRWIEHGRSGRRSLAALAREADLEWLMIYLTIVRALISTRPAQAGKKGGECPGPWPVQRGLSTKLHAAGDALGNPAGLIGSPGQRNDIAFVHELIEGFAADVTIADKGYDADHLCDRIAQTGSEVVLPPEAQPDPQTTPSTPTCTRSATSSSASLTSSTVPRGRYRYHKLLANFMGFSQPAAHRDLVRGTWSPPPRSGAEP